MTSYMKLFMLDKYIAVLCIYNKFKFLILKILCLILQWKINFEKMHEQTDIQCIDYLEIFTKYHTIPSFSLEVSLETVLN